MFAEALAEENKHLDTMLADPVGNGGLDVGLGLENGDSSEENQVPKQKNG